VTASKLVMSVSGGAESHSVRRSQYSSSQHVPFCLAVDEQGTALVPTFRLKEYTKGIDVFA
jgi:hypothetical protein